MKKFMRNPRKYQGGWAGWIAAGGAILNYLSADNAEDAQTAGANQANATQTEQFNRVRADNLPFMQRGNDAGNALSYRLGIGGGSAPGLNAAPRTPVQEQQAEILQAQQHLDQLRAQAQGLSGLRRQTMDSVIQQAESEVARRTSALAPQIQAESQQMQQQQSAQQTAALADPNYGSLLRNFSQTDLDSDVVYKSGLQFGLDEGTKGITRQAAAHGGLDTGATLKALTRFGHDYGSTKAGDAFNRFNTNKLNTFNMLSGVAGTGQVANSQVNSAGQNMANNISQNQVGVGNARGASAIAQGNALSGGLTSGYNNYQQNRLIDNYLSRNGGSTGRNIGYAYTDPYEVDGTYN